MTTPQVTTVNASSLALPVNITTSTISNFFLNQTDESLNNTQTVTTVDDASTTEAYFGLGTSVTVAISLGTLALVVIVVVVVVYLVCQKHRQKANKTWEDTLTLSYIADSNVDLTKDQFDEMVSLDNDNFLNSLDAHSFSVFSNNTNNTRQYTYSYF